MRHILTLHSSVITLIRHHQDKLRYLAIISVNRPRAGRTSGHLNTFPMTRDAIDRDTGLCPPYIVENAHHPNISSQQTEDIRPMPV